MPADELPDTEHKTVFVRNMFDAIAHRYDLVNRLMTFGLDRAWRRATINHLHLPPGSVALDLGCGTGDLTRAAARAGLSCIGLDLSLEMLREARNVTSPLIEADASALPIRSSGVEGVVTGFALRNFTDQRAVFVEIARVLRPGGRLAILEVDRPESPLIRAGHGLWFNHAVPRIGALFSDASAYRYLPKSIAYLPTPPVLETMLIETGFISVIRHRLHGGFAQIVTATKVTASP